MLARILAQLLDTVKKALREETVTSDTGWTEGQQFVGSKTGGSGNNLSGTR